MSFYYFALVALPPLMMSVILHEIAHGLVAYKLGDTTAKKAGRLSLNPIVHIDPLMTIILPTLLILGGSPIVFGGAKPVPVNPMYFKNPRKGMVWVAVAGPLTNFALLAILGVIWSGITASPEIFKHLPGWMVAVLSLWIFHGMVINLVLGAFNLFPVPPLDGGRIAVGLLPRQLAYPLARLEPYGLLIVILLLYSGVVDSFLDPLLELFHQFIGV